MSSLPARTGWLWLKQGMGLFRKQPVPLTSLLFTSILIAIGISAVPFIGSKILLLLIPSFSMAFMQACLMIENGERVTAAVLLTGFRKPALAGLCKVGVVYLGVLLVAGLVTVALMPESLRQVPINVKLEPGQDLPFTVSDFLVLLGLMVAEIVLMLTLCFAAPLTYWKQMRTGKALFYSFFAVVRAARVFLVLLLSWAGIFMLVMIVVGGLFRQGTAAVIVTLWVMFFFMVFLQCAIYVAYRDIFGKPDGVAPAA